MSECNNVTGHENSSTIIKDKESYDYDQITEQKVYYYAPQSSSVNLAWKIENFSQDKLIAWNADTKLTYGLLSTPLVVKNDTFFVKLKVPKGYVLEYYFVILKSKQGHYQDFWDLASSGKINTSKAHPIYKKANYSKIEKEKKSGIIDSGWKIFLVLIVVYFLFLWIQRKYPTRDEKSTYLEKLLFIGFSLAFFHFLARSEILGLDLSNLFFNQGNILKNLKASFQDFIFIAVILIIFILALLWIQKLKIIKVIYIIFVVLAMLFILFAFVNIDIVKFLGKPLTYQWLYYADFLDSTEAKTALQFNLSIIKIINLISFCFSALILASITRIIYRLLVVTKKTKNILIIIIGSGLVFLFILTHLKNEKLVKGKSENAVYTFFSSMLYPNSDSPFFTLKIPTELKSFNPKKSNFSASAYGSPKVHRVKNVLFIILESAGAFYFDSYGGTYELSPNLDKYETHALIFDQMYAYAPATNRTLVSILCSIYPYMSYKSLTQEAPDVKLPTLSSVLSEKGYRTSFFTSADLGFQNSKEFLAHRKFDIVEDFSTIKCDEIFHFDGKNYIEGNGIDDMCLADRLDSWLNEDTTKNFFSIIWTVQGHYPYFFTGEEKDFGVDDYNFNRYLNGLKHDDELIGRVMEILKEKGLAKKTLVLVTGDHGEAFGQHNQYGHGTGIYEENVKVPLFFINQELFHGERKSDIAGMKDLATTTLSIIGVNSPETWMGRNLLNTNSNEIFYFAPWSDYLFGYRKDNMKYIFNENLHTVEVYNLNTDPFERRNLYKPEMKEEISYVRYRIAAWVQYQEKFVEQIIDTKD